MASTNKTANLGLNQWVLSDPLLMEDVNADNRKIDAALGALPFEKIMECVVTTAGIKNVELNLKDVAISNYSGLRLYQHSNNNMNTILLRINKIASDYQYYNNGNWTLYGDSCRFDGGYVDFDLNASKLFIYNFQKCMYVNGSFKPSNLRTIDLANSYSANNEIAIGTKYILWGVKK